MNPVFVGIEIGGTKIQVVTSSHPPEIHARSRFEVARAKGAPGILDAIDSALNNLLKGKPVAGVGIGFGGPVDWKLGQIICSHQIEGWDGFPLSDWVRRRCQAPISLENDANVAALAEASHGAGKGSDPVFYVTLGSGVGGGLVVSGDIYHGHIPGEAEIGHLRLDREGLIVEKSCSGWAMDRKLQTAADAYPHDPLARLITEIDGPPAKAILPAVEQGSTLTQSILDSTATDLAFALSHVTHLVHPKTIVLGGGLSLIGEPLLSAVRKAFPTFLMKAMLPAPEILSASLGEDVVPIGALSLAQKAAQTQ